MVEAGGHSTIVWKCQNVLKMHVHACVAEFLCIRLVLILCQLCQVTFYLGVALQKGFFKKMKESLFRYLYISMSFDDCSCVTAASDVPHLSMPSKALCSAATQRHLIEPFRPSTKGVEQ